MTPGTPAQRSLDYLRPGAIELFAALDTATGTVISTLAPGQRAVGFRGFLDRVDQQTEPALAAHLICDNLSVHKAVVIHRWLLARPRLRLRFIPAYSSWLDEVQRWFAELQRRRLERGVFCLVERLCQALERWIKLWNADPHPFIRGRHRRPNPRQDRPQLPTNLRTSSLVLQLHFVIYPVRCFVGSPILTGQGSLGAPERGRPVTP